MENKSLKIAITLHILCICIFIALLFFGLKGIGWKIYYIFFLMFNIYFLIKAIKLNRQIKADMASRCEQCFHLFEGKCTRVGIKSGKMGVCWFEEEY